MKTLSSTQPYIILLAGLPGSGKSTFGEQFAKTFGIPFVNAKHYEKYISDNSQQLKLGIEVLSQLAPGKQSIIFEGVSGKRAERSALIQHMRKLGYAPLIVWMQVNEDVARQRSTRRTKVQPNAMSQQEFDSHVKLFSHPHTTERPVVISGMHTYGTQAKSLLRRLSESAPQAPTTPATTVKKTSRPTASSIRIQ